MTRFKITGALLLLVIIGGGVTTLFLRSASAATCNKAAGPPNNLCVGTNIPLDCGPSCWNVGWGAGLTYSNAVTRGQVAGAATTSSNLVLCTTTTDCGWTYIAAICPLWSGVCRPRADTCLSWTTGTPVALNVYTYNTVPCEEE